jgi:hypothetical protein
MSHLGVLDRPCTAGPNPVVMSPSRRSSRRAAPRPRRASAADTAVTPLPARLPRARILLLLGIVVVLAVAALLTVVR